MFSFENRGLGPFPHQPTFILSGVYLRAAQANAVEGRLRVWAAPVGAFRAKCRWVGTSELVPFPRPILRVS
jgi:hypothetical protein